MKEAGGTVLATMEIYDRLESVVDLGVPNFSLAEYKAPENYKAAACPLCAGPYLEQAGFGTERVEAEVKNACPGARADHQLAVVLATLIEHAHQLAVA